MRSFFLYTSSVLKRYGAVSTTIVLVLGAAFFLGFYTGTEVSSKEATRVAGIRNIETPLTSSNVDFNIFWKAWNVINDKFVTATTTTDQNKVYGAIAGLADSLHDPYTMFFPPVEKKDFEEQISGRFEGVGMEMGMKDGIITIIAPLKGNPAERAGVKSGDKILKINDTLTTNMKVEDSVGLIRGPSGTEVRLTLYREGVSEPFEIRITRAPIIVPAVDTLLRDDNVFVITIHSFSAPVAGHFREALREFVVSGSDKMIIDLRGNPGGYLEAAVDMASWFLPSGAVVVKEDRGKNGPGETLRSKGYDIFGAGLNLVILVDGGSASASEILAGALQEHGKAILVGSKTFGKGSVQELVEIDSETALKITIARWLTPNGHSISGNGIVPDITVEVTKEDLEKNIDAQMNRAVERLTKGE